MNDTIYQKGLIVDPSDELDYNDDDLMFYTTILYGQENQQGDPINGVSNALSYHDYTISTLIYDTKTYKIDLPEQEDGNIFIRARMLFRPFKPQMLKEFHQEAISHLPIIQIDTDSVTLGFQ